MGYVGDISAYRGAAGAPNAAEFRTGADKASKEALGLDMTDFLTLMVAQFQNQSMDATADTSDMLNQLVQMQMVQALVNMTDSSVMSYSASLVGKEVTVMQQDGNGAYQEIVGKVTATGSYGGEQVIYVGDEMYYLTQMVAVGRLPSNESTVPEEKVQESKAIEEVVQDRQPEAIETIETIETVEPDEPTEEIIPTEE